MEIFIINLDGNLKGFVNTETDADNAINSLANNLVHELQQDDTIRVYREITRNTVKIYTQTLGKYIDGAVILRHTIRKDVLLPFSSET